MTTYTVQSNQILSSDTEPGEWMNCVREDLYTGDNEEVYQQDAVFTTREQAETFIGDICDLMHMGGNRDEFRVVEDEEETDI
jgi:hypothetical protein